MAIRSLEVARLPRIRTLVDGHAQNAVVRGDLQFAHGLVVAAGSAVS
ncbi:hypothetical protein [Arthrobacter sp. NicSoilB8]|nr:hypothetical protein [Arthrobacter sp. NicSoilB8]